MKTQWMLFIGISLLLIFALQPLHAQGPIYNFNFHNYANEQQALQNKAVDQGQNSTKDLTAVSEKLTHADRPSSFFILLGLGRSGDAGPFKKSGGKENNQAGFNNENNHLMQDKYELGFGFNVNPNVDFLFNGHYKKLNYTYNDDQGFSNMNASGDSIAYQGSAYGITLGPQFKTQLSQTIDFVATTMFSYSEGKLEHPLYYEQQQNCTNVSTTVGSSSASNSCSRLSTGQLIAKGDYKEMGAELGLGFDVKLGSRLKLGLMGKYGINKIDLKQANIDPYDGEFIPEGATEIIDRSKTKIEAGLNLKFFI